MHEVFVGRQVVLDNDRRAVGYEILYRASPEQQIDTARTVLRHALTTIGLDHLVGPQRALLSLPRAVLLEPDLGLGPDAGILSQVRNRLVPVASGAELDDELARALRGHAERGLEYAIDVLGGELPGGVLEGVRYLRFDVFHTPSSLLAERIATLPPRQVGCVARGVEDESIYEHCRNLPFEAYQGPFFDRPMIIKYRSLATSQLAILQLIGRLYHPAVSLREIEKMIRQDVSLSYKLLRRINSAYFNLPRQVESIADAVVLLGLDNIRAWATLIALADIDERNNHQVMTALVRAKMCETLAAELGVDSEMAFTVGLLSALDLLMHRPIEEIAGHLPLDQAVHSALVYQEGLLGELLRCVLGYELADWATVEACGIDGGKVSDAYFTALKEAYQAPFDGG